MATTKLGLFVPGLEVPPRLAAKLPWPTAATWLPREAVSPKAMLMAVLKLSPDVKPALALRLSPTATARPRLPWVKVADFFPTAKATLKAPLEVANVVSPAPFCRPIATAPVNRPRPVATVLGPMPTAKLVGVLVQPLPL